MKRVKYFVPFSEMDGKVPIMLVAFSSRRRKKNVKLTKVVEIDVDFIRPIK